MRQRLHHLAVGVGEAWVPAHFRLEVGNGLLTGLRRGRLTTDQARTAVVALGALRERRE